MELELELLVEALAQRLEGRKPFPLGTIRDWKGGKVIKTEKGWEPYTGQPPAPQPAQPEATPAAPPPAEPVKAKGSRKHNKFSPTECSKALSSFLADPSPANQKAVRDQFNVLCADFGMMNRDTPPGGAQFKVSAKNPQTKQYDLASEGLHAWDGTIVVKKKYAKRAAELLSGQPAATPPNKMRLGMHVIVHETVHGHSPIQQKQFKGRYRLLEEATTEMAARKMMVDGFGATWPEASEGGAYKDFVNAVSLGAQTALQRKGIAVPSGDDWNNVLGEAAVEMRRRPPPTDPDKYAYLKRFASSLPLAGADKPEVVKEISEAVWLALKPAREQEKLAAATAVLVQKGLIDPNNPKAMPKEVAAALVPFINGLEKSRKQWNDYLSGTGSAADTTDESLDFLLQALVEALPMKPILSDDEGMLPRNNLPLAIAYAKVLAGSGKLTSDVLQDLAMLQDDSIAASAALAKALYDAGIAVSSD